MPASYHFFTGLFPVLGTYMRRVKTEMTPSQTRILMDKFQANAYLRKEEIHQLAMSLNTTRKRINNWFSHRRRKVLNGLSSQSEWYSGWFISEGTCMTHLYRLLII